MDNSNEYITRDLWLAVTIKALGVDLLRMDPVPGSPEHKYFVFDNTNGVATDVEKDWINDKIRVNPRKIVEISKEFKRRIRI